MSPLFPFCRPAPFLFHCVLAPPRRKIASNLHQFHICSSSPCKETGLTLSVPNPKSQGTVSLLSSHPPMKYGQENIVELYKMAAPSAMIWIYVLEKSRQLPKCHRSRMRVRRLTPQQMGYRVKGNGMRQYSTTPLLMNVLMGLKEGVVQGAVSSGVEKCFNQNPVSLTK